jgi:hypothetical protein
MLRLLFSRSLDSRKVKTLEKIISGPREIWLKEFQRALVGLSSGSAVPTTVFFAADEDFSSWYGEIIRSDGFIQSSTTDNNFIVSFITPSALSSYVSFKSTSEKDAFIAIESIFFNRLFELKG